MCSPNIQNLVQFIDGVTPLWEDPACKNGGRWSIRTPKTHTAKFWEDLVLAMIGEQFDAPEGEVLGLVLSMKYNNDTISVWHKNAIDDAISQQLKNSIESHLDMQEGMKFEHEIFQEVLNAPPKERTPNQKDDKKNQGAGEQKDDWQVKTDNNSGGFSGRGRGRGYRGGKSGFHGRFSSKTDNDFEDGGFARSNAPKKVEKE